MCGRMTGRRSDGGLFTKCALAPGGVISKYDGPLLTEAEADVSLSEYLMTAWSVQDKRRRVVIDGHPKFGNLAGFANYAANQVANADFEDRGKRTARGGAGSTNVVLKAKGHISAGQEIRVDYDMITTMDYNVGRPFRTQMIKRGVPEGELDGSGYTQVCWSDPGRGGAAEDGARARARTEGTDARERADAGGRRRNASAVRLRPRCRLHAGWRGARGLCARRRLRGEAGKPRRRRRKSDGHRSQVGPGGHRMRSCVVGVRWTCSACGVGRLTQPIAHLTHSRGHEVGPATCGNQLSWSGGNGWPRPTLELRGVERRLKPK